ncbi:hypothetical protein F1D05_10810 [Kribbella qitaiheensis]|uniref:Uncharacterized protein n=1 Tax=Kribbella qitaiheensis TaxID=1544730 RepID=A0A7G6WWC8_9ACTN|nr:hypothetical protein [Kribbella qitaiheensis]QNE18293.1 hypothetical protein F1D05_10810 [Kribbella qitaiheensis]
MTATVEAQPLRRVEARFGERLVAGITTHAGKAQICENGWSHRWPSVQVTNVPVRPETPDREY